MAVFHGISALPIQPPRPIKRILDSVIAVIHECVLTQNREQQKTVRRERAWDRGKRTAFKLEGSIQVRTIFAPYIVG